jgi:hypothetical protein
MKFTTTLLTAGKTATGIEVPPEVVAALGSTKRPPVRVTINGYTYRNTVAVMGGTFMVGVSAEHRAGAGVAGGDTIEVELALDSEPRVVEVPPVLAAALAKDKKAHAAFEAMSFTNRKERALAIASAKTEETRQRRLAKILDELRG